MRINYIQKAKKLALQLYHYIITESKHVHDDTSVIITVLDLPQYSGHSCPQIIQTEQVKTDLLEVSSQAVLHQLLHHHGKWYSTQLHHSDHR